MTDQQPKLHSINFKIPLAVPSHASIVRRALQVDKERHPREVQVTMEDLPSGLSITIQTTTLRLLRMNVNSLFENFDLIIRTIDGLDFSDDSRLWGEGSGKNDALKLARE